MSGTMQSANEHVSWLLELHRRERRLHTLVWRAAAAGMIVPAAAEFWENVRASEPSLRYFLDDGGLLNFVLLVAPLLCFGLALVLSLMVALLPDRPGLRQGMIRGAFLGGSLFVAFMLWTLLDLPSRGMSVLERHAILIGVPSLFLGLPLFLFGAAAGASEADGQVAWRALAFFGLCVFSPVLLWIGLVLLQVVSRLISHLFVAVVA